MDEKILIAAIESYPILYDKSRPDFKDAEKRRDAWQKIALTVNLPTNHCMRMWRNIRERYGKELKALRNSSKDSRVYESKWELYERLKFLRPHIRSRRRSGIPIHLVGKLDERLLIEMVEKNPALYDKYDANYRDRAKRMECWNKIAEHFKVSVKDCEHLWKNLRERYAKERRHTQLTENTRSRWPLYECLTFLDHHIKPRRSNNSMFINQSWCTYANLIPPFEHKTERTEFEIIDEDDSIDDDTNDDTTLHVNDEISATSEKIQFYNVDRSLDTSSLVPISKPKFFKVDPLIENQYDDAHTIVNDTTKPSNSQTSSLDLSFGNYVAQYLSELDDMKKKNKLKLSIMQLLHGDE